MTKLQSIVAEIKTLPVEEQLAVFSEFTHLVVPVEDDIFQFTEEELAEIRDILENDKGAYTMDEVFTPLLEKYAPHHTA